MKQGTELTLQEALKRQEELVAEINWIEWATGRKNNAEQILRHIQQSQQSMSDLTKNQAPKSFHGVLLALLDERINEKAVLDRHLAGVRIVF